MPLQHNRATDHVDTQDDTTVVLSASIGRYGAGTTLAVVLADFDTRLTALQNRAIGVTKAGSFKIDAFVRPVFRANAVLRRTQATSLTANAFIVRGRIRADATLRRNQVHTFTASAIVL